MGVTVGPADRKWKELILSIAPDKESSSRMAENKAEGKQEEANLGDFMGAMGALASAFSPPDQQGEIQQQFNQMGQLLGGHGMNQPKQADMFYLEKQNFIEDLPGKKGRPALFLTSNDDTEKLSIEEEKISPGQLWYWQSGLLMCANGKCLALEDSEVKEGVKVIAKEPADFEFYPFTFTHDDKEYTFIGRLAEKDAGPKTDKYFVSVSQENGVQMKMIDHFSLHSTNRMNTLNFQWDFTFRATNLKKKIPLGSTQAENATGSLSVLDIMKQLDTLGLEMENLEEKHKEEMAELKEKQENQKKELRQRRRARRAELKKKLNTSEPNQNVQCAQQ